MYMINFGTEEFPVWSKVHHLINSTDYKVFTKDLSGVEWCIKIK